MRKNNYRLRTGLLILACTLFASFSSGLYGQASAYTFTAQSGTWTPITGGTSIESPTTDNSVNSVTLTPGFKFAGTTYTLAYMSSNGLITLGGSAPSATEYQALNNSTGSGIVISPFNANLIPSTVSGAAAATRFETVGNEHVFQWLDASRSGQSDRISIQARLNTVTGQITFVYGGTIVAGTGTTNSSMPSVGVATSTSNYKNLQIGTGSESWAAPLIGSGSGNRCRFTGSTTSPQSPVSGQTYIFTPPACPVTSTPTISAIGGHTATVSWNAGGTETAWDLYYGISPLTAPTATTVPTSTSSATSYTLTGLYSANNYSVYVRANCGAGSTSVWTAVSTFSTLTTCPATSTVNVTAITAYSATASWTAGGTETAWDLYYGISPLTAPSATTVPTATSSAVSFAMTSLTPAKNYSVYVRANCGAGDFSKWTAVKTFSTPVSCPAPSTPTISAIAGHSATATWNAGGTETAWDVYYGIAPLSAPTATTVATATSSATSYNMLGLYSSATYSVYARAVCAVNDISTWSTVKSFSTSTTCTAVSTPTTNAITTTSANVTWNAGGAETAWDIYYGPTPLTAPTAATAPTATSSATSFAITGLTHSTIYRVYVRANCGGSDLSAWSAQNTFTTACGVNSLPFNQNFDAVSTPAIPQCWTVINSNGDGATWKTNANGASSPNSVRYAFSSVNNADDWLISPGVTLNAGTYYRVSFKYRVDASYPERLRLKYGTAATVAAMTFTTSFDMNNITNGSYVTANVDFMPASTGTYYMGWQCYSIADMDYIDMDDIQITLSPTCHPPAALAITAIGATTANFNWAIPAIGTPAFYKWEVRTSGAPGGAGALSSGTLSPTTTSLAVSGLTAQTSYSLYVRSDCGGGDTSSWNSSTFQTQCPALNIPYSEYFDGVTTPALPSCWTVIDANNDAATWATSANGSSTPNSARYTYDEDNDANDWLISPGLNLTGGTSYRVKFRYRVDEDYPEKMKLMYGMAPIVANMSYTTTFNNSNITNSAYDSVAVDFIPPTTGTYYLGWYAYSDANMYYIDLDNITVNLSPSCLPPTSANVTSVAGNSVTLNWSAPVSGTPAFYRWEVRTTGAPGSGSPVASGTVATSSSSVAVGGLSATTNYSVYMQSDCSGTTSNWTSSLAFSTTCLAPNLLSTNGATRCGVGTVTLSATSSGGSVLWYTGATGGNSIHTGTVLTTPIISSTTNYYAAAAFVNNYTGGRIAPTNTTNTVDMYYDGMYFDVTNPLRLNSVDVYCSGTGGNLYFELYDYNFDLVTSSTFNVPNGNGSTPYTVNLNYDIAPGTDYILIAYGNPDFVMETGVASYPYAVGPHLSLTGGTYDPTDYTFLYNWKVSEICESPRVAIAANVTTPPAFSVASPTVMCNNNAIATLSVSSTLSDFDSYTWSPSANLYTDAGATTPYTGGSAATLYTKYNSYGIYNFVATANNSTTQCSNVANLSINVKGANVTPVAVTPTIACAGSTLSLSAMASGVGQDTTTIGMYDASDYEGGPYRSGASGGQKVQYLYTAAELSAAGLGAGNISAIAFNVTYLGAGTMANYTIKMGHSAATSLSATFEPSPVNTVYLNATGYTAVNGINTHAFSTPFAWDGVSNVLIEICHDAPANSSTEVESSPTQNMETYTTGANACSAVSGTPYYRPVIIFTGAKPGVNVTSLMNWSWSPGGATTNTTTATAVNAGSTPVTATYTVTATDPASGCVSVGTVSLNVLPIPAAPSVSGSTQCGYWIPTASASGAISGSTYNWYDAASAGNLKQTGGSTYTTAIGSTTTFYVATNNGACEGPRTAVTATVTPAPPVTATSASTVNCLGGSNTYSASAAPSAAYNYTWTSSAGSGITTPVNGSSVTASPTMVGVFTYSVVGSDGTCAALATISSTVSTPPQLDVVSATPTVVCDGSSVTLNGSSTFTAPATVTVGLGAQTSVTTTSNPPSNISPFFHWYGGMKAQYIIPATELQAAGLAAGNLNSLSINVASAGAISYSSLAISMATTTATDLSAGFTTAALSIAYGPTNTTLTNGINTFALTPFYWDGTSSLVIQTCWSNNNSGSVPASSTVKFDNTSYVSSVYFQDDNETPASICGATTNDNSNTGRPQFIFSGIGISSTTSTNNWLWSSSTGTLSGSTANDVLMLGNTTITAHDYTVTATDPVSGCSSMTTVSITVRPTPAISASASNTLACSGNAITLSASGGTSYTWTPGGLNGSPIIVSPTANTTYSVMSSNSFGCTDTAVVSISTALSPVVTVTASATTLCAGNSVVLTASGANSYVWGTGATTSTISVSPSSSTTYTVSGTDATTTCSGVGLITISVSPCTGIDDPQGLANGLQVFPNPSNGEVTVRVDGISVSDNQLSVSIFDASGRLLLVKQLTAEVSQLNLTEFARGMYYLEFSNNQQVIKHDKLVIEK